MDSCQWEDMILGRLASQVAFMLRGNTKTNYTPHADCGDYVVVVNAKNSLTGQKDRQRAF